MEAIARQFLAMLTVDREGATDEALELLHQGYRLHVEMGELGMIYDTLSRFAKFLTVGERFEDATRVLAKSHALQEQLGGRRMISVARRDEKTRAALHAALDDETFARAWEEGALLTSDQAVELALKDSSLAE
jgi:hypothetical protein